MPNKSAPRQMESLLVVRNFRRLQRSWARQKRRHMPLFIKASSMWTSNFRPGLTVLGVLVSLASASAQAPPDRASISGKQSAPNSETTAAEQIIDLTHPFDEDTIYWPTEEGFRLIRGPAGVTPKGYYYTANRFCAAEHGGTHIDAPIHFFEDRQTVDQIPLERLVGEAVVIDVAEACEADRDYQVDVGDLRRWELAHGRQLVDVIVLLRTGYGQHWDNPERYLGTAETGPEAVADLRFPGLAPSAARWLVEHRAIKSIGIDTASIDYGQSQRFQSHVTLFEHNVPAFENLANLEQLPTVGAEVVALPMKIAGGSGAPLRIIATVRK